MIDYEALRENLATCKRLCGEGVRHQEGCPYELKYSEPNASPTEPELTPLQRELLKARDERDGARQEAFDWRERALKAERGAPVRNFGLVPPPFGGPLDPYGTMAAANSIQMHLEERAKQAIQQLIKLEVDSLRVEYDARMQALEERHRQRRDTEPAPSWSGAEVVPRGSSNPPKDDPDLCAGCAERLRRSGFGIVLCVECSNRATPEGYVTGPDMNEGGLE